MIDDDVAGVCLSGRREGALTIMLQRFFARTSISVAT